MKHLIKIDDKVIAEFSEQIDAWNFYQQKKAQFNGGLLELFLFRKLSSRHINTATHEECPRCLKVRFIGEMTTADLCAVCYLECRMPTYYDEHIKGDGDEWTATEVIPVKAILEN